MQHRSRQLSIQTSFQMATCRHFDQKTNRAHYIDYHGTILWGRRFLNTEVGKAGRETDTKEKSL
jgi:hypothetical protein